MKKLVLLAAFALSACASYPPQATAQEADKAAQSISALTATDLDTAIAIAKASNDQDGVDCATAIKGWLVDAQPAAPAPAAPVATGPFSAYMAAREGVHRAESLIEKVKAGAPRGVVIGCAMVTHDAKTFLLRIGALAVGAR